MKKILRIASPALFTAACAALSALFTDISGEWYASLSLPAFMPPPLVFAIVWGALYVCLAVSFSLYAARTGLKDKNALVYAMNGLATPLWTCVFFRAHNLLGALFLLIGMFLLAIFLYKSTVEKNKAAAFLLLPYIVWLAFALYLNYETAFLN